MKSTQEQSLTVLLTNDDGIRAPGLWALHEALCGRHKVLVVAPDRERSAVGHGITLHDPIRAQKISVNGGHEGWAVSGTPVDCIKLAIGELLNQRPDIVISGINPGANVGVNLNYSGTVAAAKEAALYGFTAFAVSMERAESIHFDTAARYVARLLSRIHTLELPEKTFLNINVPNQPIEKIAGIRLSRQSTDVRVDAFEKRSDPRNRPYYWQGAELNSAYSQPDEDAAVLAANYISITPVRCDMTDFEVMKKLKSLNLAMDGSGRDGWEHL